MFANTPEYREWFQTEEDNVIVPQHNENRGVTVQEEPNAPKNKKVDCDTIGTIFLKNHEPSQENYTKLFQSIPFILNSNSRAQEQPAIFSKNTDYYGRTIEDIKQGLVTVATDVQAKSRDNGDKSKYTRVPRTSQLPSVKEGTTTPVPGFAFGIPSNPAITINVIVNPNITTRDEYELVLSSDFLSWLKDAFETISDYLQHNYYTKQEIDNLL